MQIAVSISSSAWLDKTSQAVPANCLDRTNLSDQTYHLDRTEYSDRTDLSDRRYLPDHADTADATDLLDSAAPTPCIHNPPIKPLSPPARNLHVTPDAFYTRAARDLVPMLLASAERATPRHIVAVLGTAQAAGMGPAQLHSLFQLFGAKAALNSGNLVVGALVVAARANYRNPAFASRCEGVLEEGAEQLTP